MACIRLGNTIATTRNTRNYVRNTAHSPLLIQRLSHITRVDIVVTPPLRPPLADTPLREDAGPGERPHIRASPLIAEDSGLGHG